MTDADLVERVRRRLVNSADGLGAAIRDETSGLADDAAMAELERDVSAELVGAGPLEPLLALSGVTDVLVNSPDEVWIDRGRGLERTPIRFADDGAIRRLAQRLAAGAGRRLDDASPFVDAVLADGTRLHAMLPPIVVHPTLSLRVLARRRFTLDDLMSAGAFSLPVAELLRAIVEARLAFVVTGGTGTGKTTLLGAMLGCCEPLERIIIIEDAAEIVTAHPHVVRLMSRTANVEGAGVVGLAELVRQALRMRPDRLVVGEFRGAEMIELLAALNTGHEGGSATMHANAAADVPARFAALGSLAGLDLVASQLQVASGLDVVIQLRRSRDGRRVVDEVAILGCDGPVLSVSTAWDRTGVRAAGLPLARLIADRDIAIPRLLSAAGSCQ